MEANHVDPYAPPKAALTGTDNTTYLKHDGYAFQKELVANKYFKSPLICAKLGIPIPPETNPEPKLITVTRIPKASQFLSHFISIFSVVAVLICISFVDRLPPYGGFLGYLLLAFVLRFVGSKPYQVPFYLSEQYMQKRYRRSIMFLMVLIALLIVCIYGIITKNDPYTYIPIPTAFIALVIYKFKSTLFVVTETKGEFHYIRGVHPKLLEALPHLPLTN